MSQTIYDIEEDTNDGLFHVVIRKYSDGKYSYEKYVWRNSGKGYGSSTCESEYTFTSVSDNMSDLIVGIKKARDEYLAKLSDDEVLRYL